MQGLLRHIEDGGSPLPCLRGHTGTPGSHTDGLLTGSPLQGRASEPGIWWECSDSGVSRRPSSWLSLFAARGLCPQDCTPPGEAPGKSAASSAFFTIGFSGPEQGQAHNNCTGNICCCGTLPGQSSKVSTGPRLHLPSELAHPPRPNHGHTLLPLPLASVKEDGQKKRPLPMFLQLEAGTTVGSLLTFQSIKLVSPAPKPFCWAAQGDHTIPDLSGLPT